MAKTAKKTVAKQTKTTNPKSKKPSAKGASIETPMTKSELFNALAEAAELSGKEVKRLYGSLEDIIASHFKKNGPKQFTLPGLAKIVIKHKPATKARKGISPLTGQEIIFKAKPARNVVKIRPLRKLKEMV